MAGHFDSHNPAHKQWSLSGEVPERSRRAEGPKYLQKNNAVRRDMSVAHKTNIPKNSVRSDIMVDYKTVKKKIRRDAKSNNGRKRLSAYFKSY